VATSDIVALQAASLVVVSVLFPLDEAVVVHVFGFSSLSLENTLTKKENKQNFRPIHVKTCAHTLIQSRLSNRLSCYLE
jgi:hypothetical protein